MKRRRQEIRRRATARLAAELGLSVKALERQAHQMAKATRELGVSAVRFKLERHGMKLTRAEELAIARVHQILTIAMADIMRAYSALHRVNWQTTDMLAAKEALVAVSERVANGRPVALCGKCKRGPDQEVCDACHGRGWLSRRETTSRRG